MSDNKDKKRLGWENKPEPETGDTNVNINVDAPPNTVVEKKVEKKTVVVEDDKSDDTPTPSTESA